MQYNMKAKVQELMERFAHKSFILSFIFKPVMAWVLHILIIVVGLVCFYQLPVRQYPAIEVPLLFLETSYGNAGADVIESQITRPMEEALMGLTGLKSISSSSSSSDSKIWLNFYPWINMNETYTQVQNRIMRARSMIDTGSMRLRDTQVAKNDPNSQPVLQMILFGKDFTPVDLGDAALRYVKAEIESLPGVANVSVYGGGASSGGSSYKMEVFLSPDKLHSIGITANEVLRNMKGQIFKIPFGLIEDGRFKRNLTLKAELNTADAMLNNIFIPKQSDRKINFVPLSQVVDQIVVRSEDPNFKVRYAKKDKKGAFLKTNAVSVDVVAQPRSSPIEIDSAFQSKKEDIERNLPSGMMLSMVDNMADYIQASVKAVYRSLFEAILFVFLVILFFLHSVRATIVPMITIPICLIGGFAVMYFFNYTLNLLTLLAMVLATGLVVDDAVVVLENIYKYIEKGYSKFEAACLGTKEIQFSIIAMTLTLAAVYAPIALVPGLVGSVFSEFAFTLTGTVIISGFAALVLSPMMCARMLKDHSESEQSTNQQNIWNQITVKIVSFLNKIDQGYESSLRVILKHKSLVFIASGLLILITFAIARFALPSTLSPSIDSGRFDIRVQVPNGMKMSELEAHMSKVEKLVEAIPEVDSYYTQIDTQGGYTKIEGYLKQNTKITCQALIAKHEANFEKHVPLALSNVRPSCRNITLTGDGGSTEFSLSVQSNKDYDELTRLGNRIAKTLNTQKGIVPNSVRFDNTQKLPAYTLLPNRSKAAQLGVNLETLQELNALAQGINAGYFEKEGKKADIYIKAKENITTDELLRFDIKGSSDEGTRMIPLGELVTLERIEQRPNIPHQSGMRSFTIFAEIDPKYGMGFVYNKFREVIDQTIPNGYRVEPLGTLKEYLSEASNILYIIMLSLVFIYLILSAQFESFLDPFIIMGTVPLSWIGAILLLYLTPDGSLNIFSGIGFLTLVGLITKHGILIVDFANQALAQGHTVSESIIYGASTRLRPILMTTAAMVLGAVPLALSSGIGYEIRRQIGVVIVGGMTLGTIFTLFFIPCLYVVIKRVRSGGR